MIHIYGVYPGMSAETARDLVAAAFTEPLEVGGSEELEVWTVYADEVDEYGNRNELCYVEGSGGMVRSITSGRLMDGETVVLEAGDSLAKAMELAGVSVMETRFVCFHTANPVLPRTDVVIATSRGQVDWIEIGAGIYFTREEVEASLRGR